MPKNPPPPEHMNREIRTERLYEQLKNMGLFVSPIFIDGEMDSLQVSVGLPKYVAQEAAKAGVISPVQGASIGGSIESTQGSRANVVDFPTVV